MSAIAQTQSTVYRALSQANLPSVYIDNANEGATSPYIVIGATTMNEDSTKNREGEDFTVTLHVWEKTSSYNAKQIMADIKQVLNGALSVNGGFSLWLNNVEYMEVLQDPEGWRHGVLRVRLRIEE